MSYQPVIIIQDDKSYYIEKNDINIDNNAKNYASFHLTNLKGPIDVYNLKKTLIPYEYRQNYSFDVEKYDGKSAKMKINLPKNQTHSDFYKLLLDYGAKFLHSITKNGLGDWLPADSATFKVIYPLILEALNQTFEEDKKTSDDDNGLGNATCDGNLSEEDTSVDSLITNLITIVGFFQKQTYLTFNDFKKIFHQVFPSKNLSVTQLNENKGDNKDYYLISSASGDSQFTYETITSIFDKLRNCDGCYKAAALMVVVFVLYHNLCSIRESFKILKESDEEFKKLLAEEKSILNGYFEHLKELMSDIIDALNFEQFEKIIENYLPTLIDHVEEFMSAIESVKTKFNEHIEKLEVQKSRRKSDIIIGTTVTFAGIGTLLGLQYNSSSSNTAKCAALGVATVGATTTFMAYKAKVKLTQDIEQQKMTVKRFKELQGLLKKIELDGKRYSKNDVNMFTEHNKDIIPVFVKFKEGLEKFNDLFENL